MTTYSLDHLWTPQGWQRDTQIALASTACAAVSAGQATDRLGGYVVPGMPNLHSHAFQRAMAGLAERHTHASDSFWTWRETMYAFAGRVDPDDLRAIAAQLYVEMLKAGYTHVCEFHYLHHRPDGGRYADPAAMSLALIEAAHEAGIGMTLLPTLYMTGGFDGRALSERQRRFGFDVDGYLALLQRLVGLEHATLRVGIALHSLRAVPVAAMQRVLESEWAQSRPIHLHIAEQIGEVQDCLAVHDARPVEWLFGHASVDARWCLVHATHLTAAERAQMAQSGAVAGLCPSTEANLGDGLFALKPYLDAGGDWGVGSDSHISVSPIEELRWLEYGQRLVTRHRNIAVSTAQPSVGETLLAAALRGGARAAGAPIGLLAPERRADWVVLDDSAPLLAARDESNVIDTWIFAGNANLVRDVMVGGSWVVRDYHHRDEARIAERYRRTLLRLRS